ncbi:MAG: undecaprenyl-phosphate glucose phosphotransferase, partial [Rikenellaceae bacterium]
YTLLLCIFDIAVVNSDLMQQLAVLVVSYLASLSFGGIIFHRRNVRSDQVIQVVFKTIFIFMVTWCSILVLFRFNRMAHDFYVTYAIVGFVLISAYRLMLRYFIHGLRQKGRDKCNIIFIGSTSNLVELHQEMYQYATNGYNVLGYFDTEPDSELSSICPYLGRSESVIEYMGAHNIHRAYCSLPLSMSKTIIPIINYCENHLVRFYSVPNLRNYLQRRVTLEMFHNVLILSIRNEPLSKVNNRFIKRTFDIIFSLCFLCTLFPLVYIIFGVLIKCSSRGPIIFHQKRNGIDGKEFWCYKFRSMRVNVDADKVQATEHDPRKTKVGDFMRRTSIDEFPQFINVLIGNMSVVGPRPHMTKQTEEYSKLINSYMLRHQIKPGITGYAQVTGFRGETKQLSEMEGRVKADIWYMEHWTFMLDLSIIFKTITNVIARKDDHAF